MLLSNPSSSDVLTSRFNCRQLVLTEEEVDEEDDAEEGRGLFPVMEEKKDFSKFAFGLLAYDDDDDEGRPLVSRGTIEILSRVEGRHLLQFTAWVALDLSDFLRTGSFFFPAAVSLLATSADAVG